MTGTWENGILDGKATIDYADGTLQRVSYKNGLISGKVTEYLADGSYKTYSCTDGRPCKFVNYYDASGNQTSYDYFFQMQPVSILKSSCLEPDYNILLNSSSSITPYKISGTVIDIYDDSSTSYILLKDDNEHIYVLTYKNITTNRYNQALVPNLTAGDAITAYGFWQKQDSLSSLKDLHRSIPRNRLPDAAVLLEDDSQAALFPSEDLRANTSTMPFLLLFAAEVIGEDACNRLNPSYEYDDVMRNPYLYSDLKCDMTGKVVQAQINYDKQTVLIKLLVEKDQAEYFVNYSFTDDDPLPAIGDTISLNGSYAGNNKVLSENPADSSSSNTERFYTVYPRLNSNSITILD